VTAVDTARAGRREWIGLAVIALPSLLYSMDLTVLYLAVPSLTKDLEPSSSQLLWITDIYGFLIAGLLITMGTLGDRIGRRRLLLIGAAGFGAASVVAAFSTSAEMLIAARAVLGVAAATLAPSTLSLIRNMFHDPAQRTVAIGLWVTSYSVGAAIGPLVGGLLLQSFWWGSVFLLAVPVMVLLLVVGPRLLPEFRDPEPGRFDLPSAALSLVSVLAVIYGVKRMAEDGFGSQPALAIAAGLVVGAVFLHRQGRLADPMIDLQLFRAPAFSASLAANGLALFAVFGVELFIAQYLQLVLGMGPFEAGLWTLPSAAGFIVGSMVAPLIARAVRPGLLVAGGLAVASVGVAMLTQVGADSGLAALVAGSVVMALGAAQVLTLSTDLIVGAAPPERAGTASGISETGTELGGALGIAILGSVGAAVYRSDVGSAVTEGTPSHVADAVRDTLGGAVGVGDQASLGLIEAATEAFAHGMQVVAVASAVLLLAMAVLVALLLREATAETQPEEHAELESEPAVGSRAEVAPTVAG
jgi:DHA2 family multidrug resistance protein-like MFS transporter